MGYIWALVKIRSQYDNINSIGATTINDNSNNLASIDPTNYLVEVVGSGYCDNLFVRVPDTTTELKAVIEEVESDCDILTGSHPPTPPTVPPRAL